LDKHYSSSSFDENMESSDQHKTNSDVRGRKREQKETNWGEKNKAKYLRSHGKLYTEHKGETKSAKLVKMYQHIADLNAMITLLMNLGKKYFLIIGTWFLGTFTHFSNKCIITNPPEWQSKTAIKSRKNRCTVLLQGKEFVSLSVEFLQRMKEVIMNQQTKFHNQSFSL
jgi:hypothetical protein